MKRPKVQLTSEFTIDFNSPLGEGSYGNVYKGIWKSGDCFVAIKQLKNNKYSQNIALEQESIMMQALKHQNILNLIALVKSNDDSYKLILEYCQCGSLQKQIQSQKVIPQINCFKFLKQIVLGMAEMNARHHIHRDLKPQNILFTKQQVLKICDFGFARKILSDDISKKQSFSCKGTLAYEAPQVYFADDFSGKCDVWSAGVTLIQMLTGKTLQNNNQQIKNRQQLQNLFQKIKKGLGYYQLNGPYHPWFKETVKHMLTYQQEDRWSFSQLKEYILQSQNKILTELSGGVFCSSTQILLKTREHQRQSKISNNQTEKQQQQRLQKQYQEDSMLNTLGIFYQFMIGRCKLFVDYGTKLFEISNNANKFIRYMGLQIQIAIYVKTFEYLIRLAGNSESVKLPDETIIGSTFLRMINPQYVRSLMDEKQKFQVTLKQINHKLQTYSNKYPQQLKKYQSILQEIQRVQKNQSKNTFLSFQEQYNNFVRDQYSEFNKSQTSQEFLRTFWICVHLANSQTLLPIKDYKNGYIINRFISESTRSLPETLVQSINTFLSPHKEDK